MKLEDIAKGELAKIKKLSYAEIKELMGKTKHYEFKLDGKWYYVEINAEWIGENTIGVSVECSRLIVLIFWGCQKYFSISSDGELIDLESPPF